ncbi:MAG: hypothetical protein GY847_24720 [Proteobacteria bacterium]|nr:hypothetical protein [Pseudomonadota bacterium]
MSYARVLMLVLVTSSIGLTSCKEEVHAIDATGQELALGDCKSGLAIKGRALVVDSPLNRVRCFDSSFAEYGWDMEIEYVETEECPFTLAEGAVPSTGTVSLGDETHTALYCPIPVLEAPLDCEQAEQLYPEDTQEVGMYYCEDTREGNISACDPQGPFAGIDEDGDGLTDCEDTDCGHIPPCIEDFDTWDQDAQTEAWNNIKNSCRYGLHFTQPMGNFMTHQTISWRYSKCDTVSDNSEKKVYNGSENVGMSCTPSGYEGLLDDGSLVFHVESTDDAEQLPCLTFSFYKNSLSNFITSFHSCKCADAQSQTHSANPTLCECPGTSICEQACGSEEVCPDILAGSYCIPACIRQPFSCKNHDKECTPGSEEEPWDWTCQ